MTDEVNLETLYRFIEDSKKLGIELPANILQQTAELEEQLIREEVLPVLRDNIDPVLRKIKRELMLLVEYSPEKPIRVRISRDGNLEGLGEAILLTPDPIPEFKQRGKQRRGGHRGPAKHLRVTMNDGSIIGTGVDATTTFCEVLRRVGLMRVRQLNIMASGINLVSTSKDENRTQRQLGGFYIFTNTSTLVKAKQLKEISGRLGIRMQVEVTD